MRSEEEIRRALEDARSDLASLQARLEVARRRPMVQRDALEEATLTTSIQLVRERLAVLAWVLGEDADPISSSTSEP
jgi:hypothetical protein